MPFPMRPGYTKSTAPAGKKVDIRVAGTGRFAWRKSADGITLGKEVLLLIRIPALMQIRYPRRW